MIDYCYNDGGREASGRRGKARDCTVRALSILTEIPYDVCYKSLYDKQGAKSAGRNVSNTVMDRVYREFNLTRIKLPGVKPTYTEAYNKYGDCIVRTTRHVCCLKNGALQDTFDGRTYVDHDGRVGIFPGGRYERKAMSVWVKSKEDK